MDNGVQPTWIPRTPPWTWGSAWTPGSHHGLGGPGHQGPTMDLGICPDTGVPPWTQGPPMDLGICLDAGVPPWTRGCSPPGHQGPTMDPETPPWTQGSARTLGSHHGQWGAAHLDARVPSWTQRPPMDLGICQDFRVPPWTDGIWVPDTRVPPWTGRGLWVLDTKDPPMDPETPPWT